MRIRRVTTLLLAGLFTAGLGVGLGGTAHASDPTVPSGPWNEIFLPFDNGHGNPMCVDVPGGTTAQETQLQFFHCHGYASNGGPQRWIFEDVAGSADGDTRWQLINFGNNMCMNLASDPPAAGTKVVQRSCRFSAPIWDLHAENDNGTNPLFELVVEGTNLCLAASNTSDNNQTPLVVLPCDGSFQDPGQILQLG